MEIKKQEVLLIDNSYNLSLPSSKISGCKTPERETKLKVSLPSKAGTFFINSKQFELIPFLDKIDILKKSENISELLFNIADVCNIEISKHHLNHFNLKSYCDAGKIYFIYDCAHCGKRDYAKLPCNSFFCEDCRKYISARIKRHTKEYLWNCNHTFSVWTIPTEIRKYVNSWQDKNAIGLIYKAVELSLSQYCKKRKEKIGFILLPHSHGSLELNWNFHLNALISSKALNQENKIIDFKPNFKVLRNLYQKNLSKLFKTIIISKPQIKFAKDKKTKSYYIPYKRAVSKVLDYFRHIPLNIKNIDKITSDSITYHTSKSKMLNKYFKVSYRDFYNLVLQHIPPPNFRSLRQAGLYSNHNKKRKQYPTSPNKKPKKELRCRVCKYPIKKDNVVGLVHKGLLVWVNPSNPSILDCKDFEYQKESIINQNGRLQEAMPPPDDFIPPFKPKFIDEKEDYDSEDFTIKSNTCVRRFEYLEKPTKQELNQKRLNRILELKYNGKIKLTSSELLDLTIQGLRKNTPTAAAVVYSKPKERFSISESNKLLIAQARGKNE